MNERRSWLPQVAHEVQLELPLPPRPGIAPRTLADVCPRCHGVHTGYASAMACRTAAADREQY